LGIIISDRNGNTLAYLGKGLSATKTKIEAAEIKRLGLVEFLGLELAPRPRQDAGKSEYMAYVYERWKILVIELRKPRCVAGLKLARSSNMEYILRLLERYR
jgi:hypothetical protein